MAGLVFIALCIAGASCLPCARRPCGPGPQRWRQRSWPGAPASSTAIGTSPPFNLLGLLAWLPVIVLAGLSVPALRRAALIRPVYHKIKGVLPKVSATEQEALNAGTIGFDAELFSGQPDWEKLRAVPPITLTEEEKAFLDGPTNELCRMVNDWAIRHNDREIPEDVWSFVKKHGFLGMLISKEHGGLGFSAQAQSLILGRIASRSPDTVTIVMVPNSLGPGELIEKYGTPEQKHHYLPRLAKGLEVPCFALTGPDLGLRCRHHARRRLRDQGPARGQGGCGHPRLMGEALHHAWPRRRRWSASRCASSTPRTCWAAARTSALPWCWCRPTIPASRSAAATCRAVRPSPMARSGAATCSSRSTGSSAARRWWARAGACSWSAWLPAAPSRCRRPRRPAPSRCCAIPAPTRASASSSICRSARWRGSRSRSPAWSRMPT